MYNCKSLKDIIHHLLAVFPLAVSSRRQAHKLFKDTAEIVWIIESGFECDLRHRQIGSLEQRCRCGHTDLIAVIHRSLSAPLLETGVEIPFTDITLGCIFGDLLIFIPLFHKQGNAPANGIKIFGMALKKTVQHIQQTQQKGLLFQYTAGKQTSIRQFRCHRNSRLGGCSDLIDAKAEEKAAKYEIKKMTNEEIFNSDETELVINITYPLSHYEVAKQALESGKHVYTEKMICLTVEQAQELQELADKKGLFFGGPGSPALSSAQDTFWTAV